MNILYASCLCSREKYITLFGKSSSKPGQQVQKYHRLIAEGLAQNDVERVQLVTAAPLTRENSKKIFISFETQKDKNYNNLVYSYLPILNVPILRNIFVFLESFFYTLIKCIHKTDTVVICDVLNVSVSAGAVLAAKLMRKKRTGIITDLPNMLSRNKRSLAVMINNLMISQFSHYVLMTDQMNSIVNPHGKPHVVLEGQVDIHMKDFGNSVADKYPQKVCLYAGGIQKIYGIKYLTEAFLKANVKNSELHIYGNGDFKEELEQICKVHDQVKYMGVKLNEEVVKAQMKATLLINPRPTGEEYTKYSFPSKNMEYMVSGTPVLTTKLPGMPEEYNEYVYLIENETVAGLAMMLKKVLLLPLEELNSKGLTAKGFVLDHKNNIIQTKRIIDMIL